MDQKNISQGTESSPFIQKHSSIISQADGFFRLKVPVTEPMEDLSDSCI